MRKAVFICQNPFQILTAVIMRRQQITDCLCDVIVTNRSSNMDRRAELLKGTGLFDHVFFLHSSCCWKMDSKMRHYIGQARCILCNCNLPEVKAIPWDYDEIYTLFVNCIVYDLVQRSQKRGIIPEIYLVEEGYGCYTDYYKEALFGFHKGGALLVKATSILKRRIPPLSLVKSIYLYEPGYLMWDAPFAIRTIKKPDLEVDPTLKKIINQVFEYSDEAKHFENKLTIFEGIDYQDYGDSRDLELFLRIAKLVGPENVIVKLHPRTSINRFEQYGITTTDKLGIRQGIPWEVIAMNMEDDANCVFVTVGSGAVVTYSLLFYKTFHSIMMAKCLPGNRSKYEVTRLKFLTRYAQGKPDILALPESVDELLAVVRKWYMV